MNDSVRNLPIEQGLADEHLAANTALLKSLSAVVERIDSGLSVGQLLIIAAALDADKRGQSFVVSDVERLCKMPKSTASRTVASLSDFVDDGLGLLTARTHPVDRRKKELKPTPKLLQVIRQVFDATVDTPVMSRVAYD